MVACTATATTTVIDDIASSLDLEIPVQHVSGFMRENLYLSVLNMTDEPHRRETFLQLVENRSRQAGKTLVYTTTRKAAEAAGRFLQMRSPELPVSIYHAGLPEGERQIRQAKFASGETKIMIATNAYGMGIDLPDIRLVIHLDAPPLNTTNSSGLGSGGVLLFRSKDIGLQRFMIELNYPSRTEANQIYRYIRESEAAGRAYSHLEKYAKDGRLRHLDASLRLLRQHQLLYENEWGNLCAFQAAPQDLDQLNIDWRLIAAQKSEALNQLEAIRQFSLGEQCLHEAVLTHFGDVHGFAPSAVPIGRLQV